MKLASLLSHPAIRRVQGDYVLPTARLVYLGVAAVALTAGIVCGLAFLYYAIASQQSARHQRVPDIVEPAPPSIDIASLKSQFAPPRNVRAGTLRFSRPVNSRTALVYFSADSSAGFARFPNDLIILGGADAEQFETANGRIDGETRTVLTPGPQLTESLNLDTVSPRSYQVRVAVRDGYGLVSAPHTLRFTLAAAADQGATETAAPQRDRPATDLERLAQRIALFADPGRTPDYFGAYQAALRVPRQCGEDPSNAAFVGEFARAFDGVRQSISPASLSSLYRHVCEAWRSAHALRLQELARQQQAQQEIIAANGMADGVAAMRAAQAKVYRYVALVAVGFSLTVFLLVSVFLAFLALEGHTKAVREAVEALTARQIASDRRDA